MHNFESNLSLVKAASTYEWSWVGNQVTAGALVCMAYVNHFITTALKTIKENKQKREHVVNKKKTKRRRDIYEPTLGQRDGL